MDKVERAIEQAHFSLGSIEELYDYDLFILAANALLPIYLVLKGKQGMEGTEPQKADRHLRLI